MNEEKRYDIVDFTAVDPVKCPCGFSRRAFTTTPGSLASYHVVDIQKDAQLHYHKNHIEIYYILDGEGFMELDNEKIPVKPGMSVYIQKYCRHRALGALKIANVSIPVFDPEDEWFD
ncbi:MAG: cupin domain-containing protein [Lentisphaeria bacterium]|nr:cupin domain-containing protein [Lentisphaeria bacterium]